jgi:DNA (cytosine-5)-methyltransferase 1
MEQIAAIPLNGYRAISTFSGCGGSSLGYRMAGFKIVWANEFIKSAAASYRANFPETTIDPRDIRQVTPAAILRATGLKKGELDLLDGSPPCASFSTAGKVARDWGKVKAYSETKQRTDDLFFEYIRILRGLAPKVFVAENVAGLVKGAAKGYFLEILAELKAAGYCVAARVLDAQWLGVPQSRTRLIFVGVRDDLNLLPAFPKPLAYRYSVRDALPEPFDSKGQEYDLSKPAPTICGGDTLGLAPFQFEVEWVAIEHPNGFDGHAPQSLDKPMPAIQASRPVRLMTKAGPRSASLPAPTVLTHGRRRHTTSELTIEAEADMTRYAVGKEWAKLAPGEQSSRYFNLVRAAPGAPSPAITVEGKKAHAASVAHPTECRKFSIAELRRICAFPDDFILVGTYAQQWERLGRAVPPLMMRAIAETVRDEILAKIAAPPPKRRGRPKAAPRL